MPWPSCWASGRPSVPAGVSRRRRRSRVTRLGIQASQLAHFLLHAWQRLEQGAIDPEPFLVPSTSPAFRNNLDVEAVAEALGEG